MNKAEKQLLEDDQAHIWHPGSQMKDYETFKPLIVKKAYGSYIELESGHLVIDAISSWWCKSLGHNHPALKQALLRQVEDFEHVIFANTTSQTIVTLSNTLCDLSQGLKRVFYAGDGSTAVEIALKMSLHARQIHGDLKRTRFLALENSYHGETVGALSVSDSGHFRLPYQPMLFDVEFIPRIPYVNSTADPLWNDCSERWEIIERFLEPLTETTTALIIEPIVQGVAGMKIYSQDFLRRLRAWTQEHNIHLIADEIMTGLGRTGKMLACQHADIEPDFLCLSKSLTGGWMPFSAVLTQEDIYQTFYDDYENGKSFLHSNTYSGNAMAASIANEVFNIYEEENICEQTQLIGKYMLDAMHEIAGNNNKITNVRGIGAIVAADLTCPDDNRRIAFEIYQKAVKMGALLRPLGNTIYWLPPLNMNLDTLKELKNITMQALIDTKF